MLKYFGLFGQKSVDHQTVKYSGLLLVDVCWVNGRRFNTFFISTKITFLFRFLLIYFCTFFIKICTFSSSQDLPDHLPFDEADFQPEEIFHSG